MNKAKILWLCNEIEDIVNEIAACCEIIDLHTHAVLIDKLRGISAEITEPPKSNADRIRQMTDDEDLLNAIGLTCYRCVYNDGNGKCSCKSDYGCHAGNIEWLRKEVSDDAADRRGCAER